MYATGMHPLKALFMGALPDVNMARYTPEPQAAPQQPADPDAPFKAEYAEMSEGHRRTVSEADYIASRRATEMHNGQPSVEAFMQQRAQQR